MMPLNRARMAAAKSGGSRILHFPSLSRGSCGLRLLKNEQGHFDCPLVNPNLLHRLEILSRARKSLSQQSGKAGIVSHHYDDRIAGDHETQALRADFRDRLKG